MATTKTARPARALPTRPLPPPLRVGDALVRLAREKALQTLVRGALPTPVLKRLLQHAMPRGAAASMPEEIWAGLASGLALEDPLTGMAVAQRLHDRLGWDREPAAEDWSRLAVERPLEALWMAALSETKAVRKSFPAFAAECLRIFRASPACAPPSWDFVDSILDFHSATVRSLGDAERRAEDETRKLEAERDRSSELREELKRLRRENSELRGEKAQLERRVQALEARSREQTPGDAGRIEDLDRRLRKSEKEREHLRRELERVQSSPGTPLEPAVVLFEAEPNDRPVLVEAPGPAEPSLSQDPNPRRRVLRQMLRKLFKKGKIGASHTHEDNVYRGVADHEKGIAKAAMDLLYREGFLVPKPTATDPHVSLSPERTPEVREIVSGRITNPRLRRFIEEG